MKTTLILSGLLALLAADAFAGGEAIVKQRAKELSNQNNVRQGVAPPTAPPAAAAPSAASSAMAKFQTDLAAIAPGVAVTTEQKQLITRDLLAMVQGAKPASASVFQLADKLTAACAVKQLSPASRARLAQELDAVLNPAKYPQAKWDAIYTDAQAIFQDNGASRQSAVAIANDVKALAQEVQSVTVK
jgi:hypothetical protein